MQMTNGSLFSRRDAVFIRDELILRPRAEGVGARLIAVISGFIRPSRLCDAAFVGFSTACLRFCRELGCLGRTGL